MSFPSQQKSPSRTQTWCSPKRPLRSPGNFSTLQMTSTRSLCANTAQGLERSSTSSPHRARFPTPVRVLPQHSKDGTPPLPTSSTPPAITPLNQKRRFSEKSFFLSFLPRSFGGGMRPGKAARGHPPTRHGDPRFFPNPPPFLRLHPAPPRPPHPKKLLAGCRKNPLQALHWRRACQRGGSSF